VPFLIAKDLLDMPIAKFNVNEKITKHLKGGSSARVDRSLVELLTSSLTAAERGKMEAALFSSLELSLQRN